MLTLLASAALSSPPSYSASTTLTLLMTGSHIRHLLLLDIRCTLLPLFMYHHTVTFHSSGFHPTPLCRRHSFRLMIVTPLLFTSLVDISTETSPTCTPLISAQFGILLVALFKISTFSGLNAMRAAARDSCCTLYLPKVCMCTSLQYAHTARFRLCSVRISLFSFGRLIVQRIVTVFTPA